MKNRMMLAIVAVFMQSVASASEPSSVYVKNSGTGILHVWVNGFYQGFLKPGEVRYSVSDGFITNDSDRPTASGERTAVKESHAGWENKSEEKVSITYQFSGGEKKTSDVSANERGEAVFGATNKEGAEPEVPSDIERENAPAIIKGNKPNLKGSKKGTDEPRPSQPYSEIAGDWVAERNDILVLDTGPVSKFSISGAGDVLSYYSTTPRKLELESAQQLWFGDAYRSGDGTYGVKYSTEKTETCPNSGFRFRHKNGFCPLYMVKIGGAVYASAPRNATAGEEFSFTRLVPAEK
jgi:hypothetical protein